MSETVTCPRCVFKRFSLLHRLEVSRRLDAFLQDFSSAVVDSVPLVSGFVPFDLRGFSLQAVVTRLVDGGSILNQLLLGLLCTGKVTWNISGMATIVSLDITSCFLERYSVIFTRLEIGFAIGGEIVIVLLFECNIVDNTVDLCDWLMTLHAFLYIMYHFWQWRWPSITIASANWSHFFPLVLLILFPCHLPTKGCA